MKICPICDKQIKAKWCGNCHRFVTPLELDDRIYINERHEEAGDKDKDCEYHNPHVEEAYKPVERSTPKSKSAGIKYIHRFLFIFVIYAMLVVASIMISRTSVHTDQIVNISDENWYNPGGVKETETLLSCDKIHMLFNFTDAVTCIENAAKDTGMECVEIPELLLEIGFEQSSVYRIGDLTVTIQVDTADRRLHSVKLYGNVDVLNNDEYMELVHLIHDGFNSAAFIDSDDMRAFIKECGETVGYMEITGGKNAATLFVNNNYISIEIFAE